MRKNNVARSEARTHRSRAVLGGYERALVRERVIREAVAPVVVRRAICGCEWRVFWARAGEPKVGGGIADPVYQFS